MTRVFEKICRTEKRFLNELYVYESAFTHKSKLVEIKKPRTLVLEKVDGIPYLDAPEITETMIIRLAQAVAALHSVLCLEGKVLCHWDNQPKNILWDEIKQRIILLDFEDIRLARPEADIAHLFLFWAECLSDREFLIFCRLFIRTYDKTSKLSEGQWNSAVNHSTRRFDRRRKTYGKGEGRQSQKALRNRLLLRKLFQSGGAWFRETTVPG